ncbi:MAG TPA: MFS transporter [Acidimicrobiales bacterium]|nr:MFS transporter [Acidimicrobiales bacterium]
MDRDGLAAMPESGPQVQPEPPTQARGGSFRALHSRPFRIYFWGQVVSASGTFLQQTAVGWLVLELTHSASDLGLVLAAGGIPSLLFGPWGGEVADRVDLRKLLIVTQTLYCLLAALLWAFAAAGAVDVAILVGIGVAGGVVQIADSPARQAFVSRLVPASDLSSAVSLNGVVVNTARVVGPALAGVLIVTVGTTVCFGLNALSYLAVIAALLVIRPLKGEGRSAPAPGRKGVKEGLKYVASRQQLRLPLLMMSVVGLLAFNFAVILPVLAKDTFKGSAGTYGLLTTMLSIGAIVGSLSVGLIHHPRRKYLLFAALGFGIALAATAAAPDVAIACVTLVATGISAFCFVTLCSTTLQLHSSSAYRGRVMALWVFVYIGTTPIGSILTGWITEAGGARVALLVGSGACLVAALMAAFTRTPPNPDATLSDLTP